MEYKTFNVIAEKSRIDWIGRKVTGAHNGTIDIKAGTLHLQENKITSGEFVIDTTAIKILDITDPTTNAQFAAHLFSEDFFATEKYPEATFEITAARNEHIEGNLTIKGITHPIRFKAETNITGDTLTASGTIVVDRTQYDIKFRSGNFFQNLGDTLIYNEFDLNVNLTAKAAA